MPVTISPLSPSDVPLYVRVELEAFRAHPRMPMLWPRGHTADLYSYYETSLHKGSEDPENKFFKAVDDASGQIVAGAEWTFALDPVKNATAEGTAENAEPPVYWPIDGNWAMRRHFTRNLEEILKEDLGGRGYIILSILVVQPEFHGRGIGAKLLEWGVKEADRLGVPICLESTPSGLALYKKFGFIQQRVISVDMKVLGWTKPYNTEAARRIWMIREPTPSSR